MLSIRHSMLAPLPVLTLAVSPSLIRVTIAFSPPPLGMAPGAALTTVTGSSNLVPLGNSTGLVGSTVPPTGSIETLDEEETFGLAPKAVKPLVVPSFGFACSPITGGLPVTSTFFLSLSSTLPQYQPQIRLDYP